MAMVMVIITIEVIIVVLHDGGDCDVSDSSHGDIVTMEKMIR